MLELTGKTEKVFFDEDFAARPMTHRQPWSDGQMNPARIVPSRCVLAIEAAWTLEPGGLRLPAGAGPSASWTSSTSLGPSISSMGCSATNFSAASENVLVVTKKPLWLRVWWIVPRNFWSSGEPTTPRLWYLH